MAGIYTSMTFPKIDKKLLRIFIFRLIGNYLILVSLFFITKTFYDPIISEIRYFVDNSLLNKTYVVASQPNTKIQDTQDFRPPQTSQLASFFKIPQVQTIVPVDPNFSIVIPKIAANARVIPNVNTADEKGYLESLKFGVAHAAGTFFPGQDGNIFLFAHSTDYVWNINTYNAIFYLLYKLEANDEVNVFYKGVRHVYKVTGKRVVEPNEVNYLTNPSDRELLTLQTCWPPGTTLKRILIFAKPKIE